MKFLSSLILLLSTPLALSAPSASQIELIGRIPTAPLPQVFTWAYTGLRFAFIGSQANFTFSMSDANAFTISVDGSNATKIEFNDSPAPPNATVGTGELAFGLHRVEIYRVSETDHGTITFEGSQSITTDGRLVALPPSNERRIEFVGDSITVGYGVDGVNPCTDSVITENAGETYAALIGKNLSADVSLIAWSGRGVLRNYPTADGTPDGLPVMPTLWLQTSALDTTPTYTFPKAAWPQAVVVNLGTNDFAYLSGAVDANGNPIAARPPITQDQYQQAMVNFVLQIQQKYPVAKIFLVSSPMLSDGFPAGQQQHTVQLAALQGAAQQVGNNTVFVVDFPAQTGAVGCDFHPSPVEHQLMADLLGPVIKENLGW